MDNQITATAKIKTPELRGNISTFIKTAYRLVLCAISIILIAISTFVAIYSVLDLKKAGDFLSYAFYLSNPANKKEFSSPTFLLPITYSTQIDTEYKLKVNTTDTVRTETETDVKKRFDGMYISYMALPDIPLIGTKKETETQDSTILKEDNEITPESEAYVYAPPEISRVVELNLCAKDYTTHTNETGYSPDLEELLNRKYPIVQDKSISVSAGVEKNGTVTPKVLVLHTHATESYNTSGEQNIPKSTETRSIDPSLNVISYGEIIADTLNSLDIPTIHCKVLHDEESYNNSYNVAAETIKEYLTLYPSIEYVLDVHRDSITRANGDIVKTVCETEDGKMAQIMLVVGTDDRGGNHPYWEDNLNVAVKLQHLMLLNNETSARPINLRGATFNEQYTKGSLIVEIGSFGNSLEEAHKASSFFAKTFATLIKNNS